MLYRIEYERRLKNKEAHPTLEVCINDLTDIMNQTGMEETGPIRPRYKKEMEEYIKSIEVPSPLDEGQMYEKTATKNVELEIAEGMAIERMVEQENNQFAQEAKEPSSGDKTVILSIFQFFQELKTEVEYYFR